jgi:hypothetical protein
MKNTTQSTLKQKVSYIGLVLISYIASYYLLILCLFSFAFSDGNSLYDNIWIYGILPILFLSESSYLVYFYKKQPWIYKYPLIIFGINISII